jgi:hypothetical protein
MPGLPGAQKSVSQRGDCASFQASACSLPPPPTSSTSTWQPRERFGSFIGGY